jgi:hypothetical protein
MDPLQPLTVDFDSFTQNPSASNAQTFFTIFGSSFSQGFLSPSTTSVVIPAGTLMPNTTYTFELNFDTRIAGTSGGIETEQLFDVRDDGSFTTGSVPEPSSGILTLCACGLLLASQIGRRAFKPR